MNRIVRAATLAIALAIAPFAEGVEPPPARDFCSEPFVVSTVPISPAQLQAPTDYEFNGLDYTALWARHFTPQGDRLYVQEVDLMSGLRSGPSRLVDTGLDHLWPLVDAAFGGNGAEWAYSTRGSEAYYMKPFGDTSRALWKASLNSGLTEMLPGGADRGFPIPSKNPDDANPRLLCAHLTSQSPVVLFDAVVRDVPEDPATEHVIPGPPIVRFGGPRWVGIRHKVVFWFKDSLSVQQVALYDTETRSVEQITRFTPADAVSIDETWTSDYPELGPDVFGIWFLADEVELRLLLPDDTGLWREASRVNPAVVLGRGSNPYILSPEPFEYEGKPYILFALNSELRNEASSSDIWIMQPQATSACGFRRLSPDDGQPRQGPESLELLHRFVAYYWENGRIIRAETGL